MIIPNKVKSTSNFQGVSPVCLSSSCDVLAGNSAVPDSEQLSYPFRKPIIIEEIGFTCRIADAGGNQIWAPTIVRVQMALGQHFLMRDAVPIWILGTTMATSQESIYDTTLATDMHYGHCRWRLPEPLYVDAGQSLTSRFSRAADGLASVNVQVTYKGRTVSPDQPRPRVIAVPYVAPWITTLGSAYAKSNEKHLFNPFDKSIRVQRLTGRLLVSDSTHSVPVECYTPSTPSSSCPVITMDDSWGGKMVPTPTGPSDVFDPLRGAWTVDSVMPPKGVYEIQVSGLGGTTQLHVAMVGTREEYL